MNKRHQDILSIIQKSQLVGISEIKNQIAESMSVPTLNRALTILKQNGYLQISGKGPSLKYSLAANALNFAAIDAEEYFKVDIEERFVIEKFNRNIFNDLLKKEIFDETEMKSLKDATKVFVDKQSSHPLLVSLNHISTHHIYS